MPVRQRSVYVYIGLGLLVAVGAIAVAFFYPSTQDLVPVEDLRRMVIFIAVAVGIVFVLAQFAMLGQLRNVTAALQKAQARAEEAERESHARANFLATVSHELRSSLTTINGYADVLTGHMFGPLGNPKYEEYAGNIRRGGEALLSMTNDLLQIAKIGAQDGELTTEPMDVGTATGKVVAQLHPSAADKDVVLKIDVLPRPIWAFGQKEALKQALLRIVGNAIKFTETGGMIVVTVVPANGHVDIMITDNGCGMDTQTLAGINRPGAQQDAPLERRQNGLGMGIIVSRRLVERMDGKLIIESIAGRGTRATIRLQDAEAHAAPKQDDGRSGTLERDPFKAQGQKNPFHRAA